MSRLELLDVELEESSFFRCRPRSAAHVDNERGEDAGEVALETVGVDGDNFGEERERRLVSDRAIEVEFVLHSFRVTVRLARCQKKYCDANLGHATRFLSLTGTKYTLRSEEIYWRIL